MHEYEYKMSTDILAQATSVVVGSYIISKRHHCRRLHRSSSHARLRPVEVREGGEARGVAENSIVVKLTYYVEIRKRDSLAVEEGRKEGIIHEVHWVIRQRFTVISP